MADRFKNTLYTIEDIKTVDGQLRYVRTDDGTLYSGVHRTKIKPIDLPEWYLYGRYYKRFGYMSTKGITDLVYIPSRFSNHYLKDDCLLVSYGDKITEITDPEKSVYERYQGWHERVWGSEIVTILRGARKYSAYDITPFIEKLKWKKEFMHTEFPSEFAPGRWNVDVDKMFEKETCPYCHVNLEEKSVVRCDDRGGCEVLALCNECLRTWKWYRDPAGWSRDMEQYFFG